MGQPKHRAGPEDSSIMPLSTTRALPYRVFESASRTASTRIWLGSYGSAKTRRGAIPEMEGSVAETCTPRRRDRMWILGLQDVGPCCRSIRWQDVLLVLLDGVC